MAKIWHKNEILLNTVMTYFRYRAQVRNSYISGCARLWPSIYNRCTQVRAGRSDVSALKGLDMGERKLLGGVEGWVTNSKGAVEAS